MTTSDTNVSNLIINVLTKQQYESIQNPSNTELYMVTDEGDIPDQTGNAGKFLTTNGTSTSWATVSSAVITETYSNGTSWYRVYSDGWCEQGGRGATGSGQSGTIALLKTYADTNYSCLISASQSNSVSVVAITGRTSSTVTVAWPEYISDWIAAGYLPSQSS